MTRRVVITGMGVVTPLGNDVDTLWNNLIRGKSGVGRIESFDVREYPVQIAGEVRDFDAERYLDRKEARKFDRFTVLAIGAAMDAVRDSKLTITDDNRFSVGGKSVV